MGPTNALISSPESLHRLAPLDVLHRWPRDLALVMLHSGRVHPRWARWSIIAPPRGWYIFDSKSNWMSDGSTIIDEAHFTHDPLRDLDAIIRATSHDSQGDDQLLPFHGGWIGYFSYDLGRIIEPKAQFRPRPIEVQDWPLIQLAWCPDALIFDHLTSQWHAVGDCSALIDELHRAAAHDEDGTKRFTLSELRGQIPPEQYMSMVQRTVDYIAAGDIFQANIAQRFSAELVGNTRALCHAAFQKNQPWYGAYLELPRVSNDACHGQRSEAEPDVRDAEKPRGIHIRPDLAAFKTAAPLDARTANSPWGESLAVTRTAQSTLISLSPELFLEVDGRSRRVITRPIKGTRPASSSSRELQVSEKDTAELNMIIDLMRNDLGRVCEIGSIEVANAREIESHATVHHGVGEVHGTLRGDVSSTDLLRATFPGGSVTGAPKIRAMQIIDELEFHHHRTHSRGPYCGAIGFISNCGNVTLNIAIRTMLLRGKGGPARGGGCGGSFDRATLHYSAGAGIVADSNAAGEFQETLDKTAALHGLITTPRAR